MLNELISLLKDTTLVSVIALDESVLVSREILVRTAEQLGPDPRRAVFFLVITLPMARLVDYLIKRNQGKITRGAPHRGRPDWPSRCCKLQGDPQALRRARSAEGHRPRRRQRRSGLHPRPQRLRQEHAAALRQPARAARGGRDLPRGPGHLQGPGLGDRRAELEPRLRPPAGRDGLPAVQPLPPQDRAGERDHGAGEGARQSKAEARGERPRRCWSASASPTSSTSTPNASPAASSSGSRSPGRWRWNRT